MTFAIYAEDTCIGQQEASTDSEALELFCRRFGWKSQAGMYAELVLDDRVKAGLPGRSKSTEIKA